jgi:hypothetical protein
MPRRVTFPDPLAAIAASWPLNIGGTSVPKAAQKPSATPIPSDIPR